MKLLTILAGILILLASQSPAQESLPIGSAIVADFKGEVSLHSLSGDALVVQNGLVLDAESTIQTAKGTILLNLQDGSQVLIKSQSHVVLKSPQVGIGLYLELFIGKLLARVQKRMGEAPAFRIGTPSAVITVRGTRFEVEVTKKQRTYVQVYEGIVEVRGLPAGGRSVLVWPGFSTQVNVDRDPQEPRNLAEEIRKFNERPGGREMEAGPPETERPAQPRTGESGEHESEGRPD
jgi:hypothetical protein